MSFKDVGVRVSLRAQTMRWSRDLAYTVGLITTDGNLSKDGRHIELTSKDLEQIETFISVLKITNNKISVKSSSYNPAGKYYRVQFSNVDLYKFLLKIGLTPNKTKTIGRLKIPDKYFPDFLRGHLDGDGYTSSFWDSVYKNSFRLFVVFISASEGHLQWLENQVQRMYGLDGSLQRAKRGRIFQLRYAKKNFLSYFGNLQIFF